MSGKGKYTKYVPPNETLAQKNKRILLQKMYSPGAAYPFIASLTAATDDTMAAKIVADAGNKYLTPAKVVGNPMFLDDKDSHDVSLEFKHPKAPDYSSVAKDAVGKTGGPATPYFPNIKSPGAVDGQVNFAPHDGDPEISVEDIKPSYVVGTAGTSDPVKTTENIAKTSILGTDLVKGHSQKS